MGIGEAINVFTKLTIGDGLVSQVPAFLISLASGIIVTRSSSSTDLNRDVLEQLFSRPGVLGSAAGVPGPHGADAAAQAAAPGAGRRPGDRRGGAGLPSRGARRGGRAVAAGELDGRRAPRPRADEADESPGRRASRTRAKPRRRAPGATGEPAESGSERMEDLLHVDPLELEIGFRLIGLADPARGGDLLARLKTVRQRVAREMGLIVPQVRIHDSIGLPPNEYRVKIRGTQVGQGIAYAGRLLAVPPAGLVTRPDGRDGVDPVTGQPAVWIHADGREVAELAGCRVLDAASGRRRPLRRDRRRPCRRAADPRAGRAAARAGPLVGADARRRGRAGAAPRRRAAARPAEPAPRARQHPRSGDDPRDARRRTPARTRDIEHLTELVRRSLARQITETLSRPRRPAPRRHAGPPTWTTAWPPPAARPRRGPPRPSATTRPGASSTPRPPRSARCSRTAIPR